jgi:hypothetical protein
MTKKYVWTFSTPSWSMINKLLDNLTYLAYSTELVKLINNTELIIHTDSLGYKLLKNMNIRAEIVHQKFFLRKEEMFKWAMPKLKTIELINEPFYHIDHDVFLFNEQPIKNVPITAQSLERYKEREFYFDAITNIRNFYPNSLPEWCKKYETYDNIGGFNCGYLHFQSMPEKKQWTDLALSCYKHHTKEMNCKWAHVYHNVISEQFTLFALNQRHDQKLVDTLFNVYNWNNLKLENYVHVPSVIKFLPRLEEIRKRTLTRIMNNLKELNLKLHDQIKELARQSSNPF